MNAVKKSFVLAALLGLAACGGEKGAPPAGQPSTTPGAQPTGGQAAEVSLAGIQLPEGVTAEMVAQGKAIFTGVGLCHTCHMADGTGGPLAPDLTDGQWINTDGTYEGIVNLVLTGVPEPKEHPGIMLPKGGSTISDEEVRAVAAYVWTLSHRGG